jgi:hypothetical protein
MDGEEDVSDVTYTEGAAGTGIVGPTAIAISNFGRTMVNEISQILGKINEPVLIFESNTKTGHATWKLSPLQIYLGALFGCVVVIAYHEAVGGPESNIVRFAKRLLNRLRPMYWVGSILGLVPGANVPGTVGDRLTAGVETIKSFELSDEVARKGAEELEKTFRDGNESAINERTEGTINFDKYELEHWENNIFKPYDYVTDDGLKHYMVDYAFYYLTGGSEKAYNDRFYKGFEMEEMNKWYNFKLLQDHLGVRSSEDNFDKPIFSNYLNSEVYEAAKKFAEGLGV